MIPAWRLVARVRAETAFDGEGSYRYGNRWNRPGTRVTYLAATTSLAALEVLVHAGSPDNLVDYAAFPVEIPAEAIRELKSLPSDWRTSPAPASTQDAGSRWEASAESPVLRVPSVVVPWEHNYVVAVGHRHYPSLSIGEPRPFRFDRRLAGGS